MTPQLSDIRGHNTVITKTRRTVIMYGSVRVDLYFLVYFLGSRDFLSFSCIAVSGGKELDATLSCTLLNCIRQTGHLHPVWCISPLTVLLNGSYADKVFSAVVQISNIFGS